MSHFQSLALLTIFVSFTAHADCQKTQFSDFENLKASMELIQSNITDCSDLSGTYRFDNATLVIYQSGCNSIVLTCTFDKTDEDVGGATIRLTYSITDHTPITTEHLLPIAVQLSGASPKNKDGYALLHENDGGRYKAEFVGKKILEIIFFKKGDSPDVSEGAVTHMLLTKKGDLKISSADSNDGVILKKIK